MGANNTVDYAAIITTERMIIKFFNEVDRTVGLSTDADTAEEVGTLMLNIVKSFEKSHLEIAKNFEAKFIDTDLILKETGSNHYYKISREIQERLDQVFYPENYPERNEEKDVKLLDCLKYAFEQISETKAIKV